MKTRNFEGEGEGVAYSLLLPFWEATQFSVLISWYVKNPSTDGRFPNEQPVL
jgi:hypothetical protein